MLSHRPSASHMCRSLQPDPPDNFTQTFSAEPCLKEGTEGSISDRHMLSGSPGSAFHCTGEVTREENVKFLMSVPHPNNNVEQFRLKLNVSVAAEHPLGWNASTCHGKLDAQAAVHYMQDVVELDRRSLTETRNCSVFVRESNLFCVRPAGRKHHTLSMAVQADRRARVEAYVEAQQGMSENLTSFSFDVPGGIATAAYHLFRIPHDVALDLWNVRMNVPDEFQSLNNTYTAYVIHEQSLCISSSFQDGGCFDPAQIWSCTHSIPVSFRKPDPMAGLRVAMWLSFSKSGSLTISRGSRPSLRSGRWLLFVTCNWRHRNTPCGEAKIDVALSGGYHQRRQLWIGAAIMIFGPALVLSCVNAMCFLAYEVLYRLNSNAASRETRCRSHLWPVFLPSPGREHWDLVCEKIASMPRPVPFFPGLLALMIGVFLATAAQFVITHYGLMVRTGNRDICFYNEKCFSPGLVWDVPWNNMLSNVAYFVAGAHTMMQAFFAEVRCRQFLQRTFAVMFKDLVSDSEKGLKIEQWHEIFDSVDSNRNGRLSRGEWHAHYGNILAFDFIDRNDDGELSREEWSRAFDRLDTAGDGHLTPAEFRTAADIDLRSFYAVAITFWAEGIGSMCYHLCPSVETFQFDTCFMIPIANLLTIALLDWREGEKSRDGATALRYFVYVLTPIWVINFIGTWYDIDVFDCTWLYWIYAVAVVAPRPQTCQLVHQLPFRSNASYEVCP